MTTQEGEDTAQTALPLAGDPNILERRRGDQIAEDGGLGELALQVVPPLDHAHQPIEAHRARTLVAERRSALHEGVVAGYRGETPPIRARDPPAVLDTERIVADDRRDVHVELDAAPKPDAHRNVLVFGDRDQAIRPKDTDDDALSIFDQFRQLDTCGPGSQHRFLTNFRTTQEILDFAMAVRNHGERDTNKRLRLVAARGQSHVKPLVIHVHQGREAAVLRTSDARATRADEEWNPREQSKVKAPPTADLEAMLDAVLAVLPTLDHGERGSVAIVPALSNWQFVLEQALRRRNVEFSVLGNTVRYQQRHVDYVLLYLRLIVDPSRDEDATRLLRYCVAPYFEPDKVRHLADIARAEGRSIMELLESPRALREARVAAPHRHALLAHLAVLKGFGGGSLVCDVADALRQVPDNPIAAVGSGTQKAQDIQEVLEELGPLTVNTALEKVCQHLTFLDQHRDHAPLILSSIDNAKSEEFDTVFILGPDRLSARSKRRLYVAVSRARQRLVILVSAVLPDDQRPNPILLGLSSQLYDKDTWPPTTQDGVAPGEDDIPF